MSFAIPQQVWIDPKPVEVPQPLTEVVGGHPLVATTLVRRGIQTPEQALSFLFSSAHTSPAPQELPDLSCAADRLEQAIRNKETIGVWGDFDVDGQTATTLLVSTLRHLGAIVQYHIPIRSIESHGINLTRLKTFLSGGVSLLLTCDTGITAHDAVDYARSQGVDTLITDHHSLPPQLPSALAIVNPQRLSRDHPLSSLSGVGTAFELIKEIYHRAGRLEELDSELDLVALGTVADLAQLKGENRYLVRLGLECLRSGHRLALQTMLELAEVDSVSLNEEHISFVLAPRLNALGRLGDANPIVDFLTSSDLGLIRQVATQLEGLNGQRKLLCDQVFQAALSQIQADRSLLETPVLVLQNSQWPGGVVGIVASRLVELYHRPVVLLTTPVGEPARGSARSIEGINITQAIAANQALLLGFGGHPMAAGLSLTPEKIPEFRRALARTILEKTAGQPLSHELQIDAYLPLGEATLELVEDLDRLAPFGPGNPPLVFCSRGAILKSYSSIGKTGEHLQLIVEDSNGESSKVIWWQGAGSPLPEGRFDLAYQVRSSNYRAQRTLQIEWLGARLVEESTSEINPPKEFQIRDMRMSPDPLMALQTAQIQEGEGWVIWSEGDREGNLPGADRYHLPAGRILAIWSIPPGRAELLTALEAVKPYIIYLFSHNPGLDSPQTFLNRLSGLVRHALAARQGLASLEDLAAATGQCELTVRRGLDWLVACGHINLTILEGNFLQLSAGSNADSTILKKVEHELILLLKETAAFRNYYLRADPQRLLEKVSKKI